MTNKICKSSTNCTAKTAETALINCTDKRGGEIIGGNPLNVRKREDRDRRPKSHNSYPFTKDEE